MTVIGMLGRDRRHLEVLCAPFGQYPERALAKAVGTFTDAGRRPGRRRNRDADPNRGAHCAWPNVIGKEMTIGGSD